MNTSCFSRISRISRISRTTLLSACVALSFAATAGAADGTPELIDEGTGWQLMLVQPVADEQGVGALSTEPAPIVMIDSAEGLMASPLPASIKSDLAADFAGPDDVSIAVHYDIATAIANGTAEADYADFLEPDDADGVGAAAIGCSTGWRHREKNYVRTFGGFRYDRSFTSGGFTGDLDINVPLQGEGGADIEYAFKKTAFCLPYTVKFVKARAYASITVNDTLFEARGTARYETSDRMELLKPDFRQAFMVGPVPVVLGVEFPLGAGYAISGAAEGEVVLKSAAQGTMSVDVTCTADGCQKNTSGNNSSNISFSRLLSTENIEGGLTVQVDFKPYLYAEARAFLYHPSVASAGIGAELSAPTRLFYHAGGGCGPGNVHGGFIDVGAQLEFYWNATLLGADRFNWIDTPISNFGPFKTVQIDDFLRGGRAHTGLRAKLYFADFSSGTSPLSPVLVKPSSVTQGNTGNYSVARRSCVPLDQPLNYSINWGDSQTDPLSGAADAVVPATHTYTSAGTRTITATLIGDTHGRSIQEQSTTTVNVLATVPPPTPASISVPATDADGTFNASWSSTTNASSYKLFRRSHSGSTWGAWSFIKTVTGQSSTSLSGQPFGTSQYGVQACNVYGCSPTRTSGAILVGVVPAAPQVTVRSHLCFGGNDVSWTAPAGATSYRMYISTGTNPNAAGQYYSGPLRGQPLNVSSNTNVWVKACGTGGCGNFSTMKTATRYPVCN